MSSFGGPSSSIRITGAPSSTATSETRTPTKVNVHPVALFSILDHYLRRGESQQRVIGTLLGTRTGSEIHVRSAFAVLHSETDEQVAVDMEYHQQMYELHHKMNPKEIIVGWYSTGSELNTYSALIQNFYSTETSPQQAVHLAVSTGLDEAQDVGVKAYISTPVGVAPKPENCVFLPIPVDLRFHETERGGLDLLLSASQTPTTPLNDIELLEKSLLHVTDLLDKALDYVQSVIAGERKGDKALGRYLMDTLGANVEEALEKGSFHTGLQDSLMISYLANLVRAQAEVSSRLALVSAS